MGKRGLRSARVRSTAIVVALSMVFTACEVVIVGQVNGARDLAATSRLATSDHLTTAARARAAEMCTAGAVSASADVAADYLGEPATAFDELVASAPLDSTIENVVERIFDAGTLLWDQWSEAPTLVDPRWESIGVGQHVCSDGQLYAALVLRDDPPELDEPADTSLIVPAESTVVNGWHWQRYRNLAYPCAISGHHSFVVGTKVGSSPSDTRPLWVRMRGGGVGWFDEQGRPQPNAGVKSEESLEVQLGYNNNGLMASALDQPVGFRALIVSMCSHDLYAGNDNYDPYNANPTADGGTRPVSGLTSTKSAIQFTHDLHPTDDMILHGTSAGGYGSFHVAWALQRQGIPPAGIVSDSGVANVAWQQAVAAAGLAGTSGCQQTTTERLAALEARLDPEIVDPANQPHLLVADGRLEVPVMVVWNRADRAICGESLIECPLPDGSTPVLRAADCNFQPIRLAIDSLGPTTRSAYMGLCVERPATNYPCDAHVLTTYQNGVNTDPSAPAQYNEAILGWVFDRLEDP